MIRFIKSLFVSKPGEKVRKLRDRKYKEAVQLQRDGNLREYAAVMKEIQDLEEKYVEEVNEGR